MTDMMSLDSCQLAMSSFVMISLASVGVPPNASRTKVKCLRND
jgi:hypothetical protein